MILLTEIATGAEVQIGDTLITPDGTELRLVGLLLINETIHVVVTSDLAVQHGEPLNPSTVSLASLNLITETKYALR